MIYKRLPKYKYQLIYPTSGPTGIKGYQIAADYIMLSSDGEMIIRGGYTWDGPSGPAVDTGNFMTPSLYHDAFYQLLREGHLPKTRRIDADRLLYKMCRDRGMSWIRAQGVYRAVRMFGGGSVRPGDVEILEVE